MPDTQLLSLSKILNIYLQPVAVQIKVWLKGILNLFKSRKNGQKTLLFAVSGLHMERLSEKQIAKRLQ